MDWLELTVSAPLEAAEAVAETLRRRARGGVAIEEPFLPLDGDGAYALDSSHPARLRAYLPLTPPTDRDAIRRGLRSDLARLPWPATLRTRRLASSVVDGWAEAWKAHFGVEKVGRRLVVCPSWIEYAAAEGELVIRLDPGMAFGTGQHATTRLCLRALEDYVRPGVRVLDVGTGSGILAIAAAVLGAESVTAVDTDPLAVDAARANARANGVDGRVTAKRGTLGAGRPFEGRAPHFDVIAANIHTAYVLESGGTLVGSLAPGGVLIVSGVPEERRVESEAALVAAGGRTAERRIEGGWCALVARRSRPGPT